MGLIPGLGISTYHGCGPKNKKKTKQNKKDTVPLGAWKKQEYDSIILSLKLCFKNVSDIIFSTQMKIIRHIERRKHEKGLAKTAYNILQLLELSDMDYKNNQCIKN